MKQLFNCRSLQQGLGRRRPLRVADARGARQARPARPGQEGARDGGGCFAVLRLREMRSKGEGVQNPTNGV